MCSFCLYFADVFSSTMWSDLRAAVPQGSSALQSLASSLPDVALASRAPSTSSKYFSSYNRWRSWAREHGLTVFPACPVAMMNRYLDRAGLSCDSPLFCQLSKTKCGYKPRSKGLSYSRLRELVLEAFKDIVPDISAIGTHSLRSAGATAAANAGVPDRLFKRHGRWASESAIILKTDMSKILYLLVCRFLSL